jgi:hypothetical protein
MGKKCLEAACFDIAIYSPSSPSPSSPDLLMKTAETQLKKNGLRIQNLVS